MTRSKSTPALARPSVQLLQLIPVLAGLSLAIYMVASSTRLGIGTSPDSAAYLGAAHNLLAGKGLTLPYGETPNQPLVHYPPLYSLVLAIPGLLGVDLYQGARVLQALFMAVNLLIAWFYLKRLLGNFPWVAAVAVLPLATVPTMLLLHVMAWSEGLFLAFGFSGLYLAVAAIERSSRWVALLAGFILALAFLTRYVGLAFIAAAGLSMWLFSNQKFSRRVLDSLILELPGVLALLGLSFWDVLNNANPGNRSLVFHLPTQANLLQGVDTLSSWLLVPVNSSGLFKLLTVLVFGGVVLGIILVFRGRRPVSGSTGSRLPFPQLCASILIVFMVVYGLAILLSLTFFDANTPLDARILSPILVSAYLLAIYALGLVTPKSSPQSVLFQLALTFAMVYFSLTALKSDLNQVSTSQEDGIGFFNKIWRLSPTLGAIAKLPSGVTIQTNSPEAVYVLKDRFAAPLPRSTDLMARRANDSFPQEMAALQEAFLKDQVAIVYFNQVSDASFPPFAEIFQETGSGTITSYPDGKILTDTTKP